MSDTISTGTATCGTSTTVATKLGMLPGVTLGALSVKCVNNDLASCFVKLIQNNPEMFAVLMISATADAEAAHFVFMEPKKRFTGDNAVEAIKLAGFEPTRVAVQTHLQDAHEFRVSTVESIIALDSGLTTSYYYNTMRNDMNAVIQQAKTRYELSKAIAPPSSPVDASPSPSPVNAETVTARLSPVVINVMPAIPVPTTTAKKGRKPRAQARNVLIAASSSDYLVHAGNFARRRNISIKGLVISTLGDDNDNNNNNNQVVGVLTLTRLTDLSLIRNGLAKAGFADVKLEPFASEAKYDAARSVFVKAGARRAGYFEPENDEELHRIFVTLEKKVIVAKLNKAIDELKAARTELATNKQTIDGLKLELNAKEQALAASEKAYNEAKVKAKTFDDNMEELATEHTKLYQWQVKINAERAEVERIRREVAAEKRAMAERQQTVAEREDAVAMMAMLD